MKDIYGFGNCRILFELEVACIAKRIEDCKEVNANVTDGKYLPMGCLVCCHATPPPIGLQQMSPSLLQKSRTTFIDLTAGKGGRETQRNKVLEMAQN